MDNEKKKLLIEELSARLPFRVKVYYQIPGAEGMPVYWDLLGVNLESETICVATGKWCYRAVSLEENDIKVVLRPMLSMDKDEFDKYEIECGRDCSDSATSIKKNLAGEKYISSWYHGVYWLNKNHFDYRRSIENDVAVEAPEGLYKTE